MHTIQVLSEQLINQIAAGEVVERPASVVKELLENSIDAGAKQIVIEVEEAGSKLIRITDNGCGMSKEDAILCLERHATSKISSLDDLQKIATMGFRGEALASIASVSKLKIITKRVDQNAGIVVIAEGGVIEKVEKTGAVNGTVIEIAELFYNTPARKKFMKSEQTEYQNILDTIINAALVHEEIAFRLVKDGKAVLDLPATEDDLVRIRSLLGKGVSEELLEVFYGGVNLKIKGFIGKPSIARSSRNMQFFFVNDRPIKSHVLAYAVKQAYKSLILQERQPVFVIKFGMEPSMVDVNIHPRKTEVKFRDEREIFRVLTAACEKTLQENVLTPKISGDGPANYYQQKRSEGIGQQMDFAAEAREPVLVASQPTPRQEWQQEDSGIAQEIDKQMRVLGCLNDSFILCQKGSDLVIVDQHAAHERIHYQKLKAEFEAQNISIQPLLTPVNVDLNPADQEILNNNKAFFEEIGLQIEYFGGNTFAIQAVPDFLAKRNLETMLLGLIDDLGNEFEKTDLKARKDKALTYMACRSAVKFGDKMSHEEMVALIEQLDQTDLKYSCPHGRPVMVMLEEAELWSRFGRKYIDLGGEKFRGVNC